jgi:hypothetical protein
VVPLGLPPTALRGTFGDDVPLELGEGAEHLKKKPPGGRAGIELFGDGDKANPIRLQGSIQDRQKVLQSQESRSAL